MKQSGVKAIARRKLVIERLEKQVADGTKNTKEGVVSLEVKDLTRIEKELKTLNTRL